MDDEPIHYALFARVLGEEGIVLSEEVYYRQYLSLDDRGCFTQALRAAGKSAGAAEVVRLTTRKASYYREQIRREGYPFFPGARELVRSAATAGLTLGVVSGALREEVEAACDQAGLSRFFKVLVTAEDVSEGKPDPQGYLRGIEALNSQPPLPDRLFHPHEVLAIEDSPGGLQAAAAAGLATLGVAHTYPADGLVADRVVRSLAGLSIEELLRISG